MAFTRGLFSTVALASATSANGTARNGATLPLNQYQPGVLAAHLAVTIVTGSVVCTGKWQVSIDGSTFVDLKDQNNAASVTITVTDTRALSCPLSAFAYPYARFVATLSGAATAAGDLTQVDYRGMRFGAI